MCGGGSKKSAPVAQPSPVVGYSYSPADNSNMQRQVAAVAPDAGKQARYGSELASAPAPTTGAN